MAKTLAGAKVLLPEIVNEVKSPMSGLISAIFVKPGDSVKKGDALFEMESMKMKNTIFADRDCVVQELKCSVGDVVAEGDILIENAKIISSEKE